MFPPPIHNFKNIYIQNCYMNITLLLLQGLFVFKFCECKNESCEWRGFKDENCIANYERLFKVTR